MALGLTVVLIVVGMGMTTGCMVRTPPSPDRYMVADRAPAAVSDDIGRWPARYIEPLLTIANRPVHLRSREDEPSFKRRRERLIGQPDEDRPGMTRFHGVYGRGIISELVRVASTYSTDDGDVPYRRSMYAFVSTAYDGETFLQRADLEDHGVPSDPLTVTYFILREPIDMPVRGVVFHVASVYPDSPYERALKFELLSRGWLVIDCDRASSMFASPGLMFAVLTDNTDDTDGPADEADRGLRRAARSIARGLDDRMVEWAYAVEGMLAFLDSSERQLDRAPVVIVGCSLGAIATPTIVARQPDRFDATVLIGGGANALEISQRSSLTNAGIELLQIGSPLTTSQRRELYSMYLRSSRFDPYHTAAHLHHLPVLVLDAMFDRMVPASTGRALYERLGRPERWSYPVGHAGLFWLLPSQRGRIADWIERAVAALDDRAT